MRITLKTKIWLTVTTTVMMFAFFILFYLPAQQEKSLLKNFNQEVQNMANTVSLGVKIAITEQNFEGVQTAMDFVKGNPQLRFISILQYDTLWDGNNGSYTLNKVIFKTYPENFVIDVNKKSSDSMVVKHADFQTSMMSGAILLGFSTREIVESKRQIRLTSLMVSALVFFIGILIGFWLAKSISVPVLALRDAANKVGQGDLSQRVHTQSRDEIGELSIAFNKMVHDLERAQDELTKANINLATANNDLSTTLTNLQSTQAQLVQSEKMASLGLLTAGIAHEIQNPLNFVNNFSEISAELIEDYKAAKTDEEKEELMTMMKSNLEKITHHGKRADKIVKEMLMYSREQKGEAIPIRINQLLDEATTIAYHGIRAKNSNFQCEILKDFDPAINKIHVIQQDMNRVVINMLNNAFYSVRQRAATEQKTDSDWKPVVTIATKMLDKKVHLIISDNGTGIPKEVIEKIFNPFFTTKPTGEGTGLGLSICYDIIKSHGGTISVESEVGKGTQFSIILNAA